MFYFRFVAWLIAKSDRWTTKIIWGDAGLYNFDATRTNGLMQLFRLLIVMFFYGLPILGIVKGINALPISAGEQGLVFFLFFLGLYIVIAIVMICKATKKRRLPR
ncbi:MAG TPA: hypothetical protein VLG11_04060 [Candidatus Saccharimonadales bacterium]|nr:hypothetical protein [Candidatus Saccharimonadales bacterium]